MTLLSFVIPTKNRSFYVCKLVDSLLRFGDMVEIIISNTSEDEHTNYLKEYLMSAPKNVVFINNHYSTSVVDNFNIALSYATGEYMIFLGDDDLVSSEIIDIVIHAKKNNIDSINFSFPVHYYWPGFICKYNKDKLSGTLQISNYSGQIINIDSKKELIKSLSRFGTGPCAMPRAYAGVISRRIVNLIIEKHKFLFGGVSPDVYSSALISYYSNKCIQVDYPIVIPGACPTSTAAQSAGGGHIGDLRGNDHIRAFGNLNWSKIIPEYYSVYTVWGYSLAEALKTLGDDKLSPNYAYLFLRCYVMQRSYKSYIYAAMQEYIKIVGLKKFIYLSFGAIVNLFYDIAMRAFNKAFYKTNNTFVINNVNDSIHASESIDNYLIAKKITLKLKI